MPVSGGVDVDVRAHCMLEDHQRNCPAALAPMKHRHRATSPDDLSASCEAPVGLVAGEQDHVMRPSDRINAVHLHKPDPLDKG